MRLQNGVISSFSFLFLLTTQQRYNSQPASRAYVSDIFHLVDVDNSGSLSKDEFSTAIKILYSQVFTRIIIQWMLTLMSELLLPIGLVRIKRFMSGAYFHLNPNWLHISTPQSFPSYHNTSYNTHNYPSTLLTSSGKTLTTILTPYNDFFGNYGCYSYNSHQTGWIE